MAKSAGIPFAVDDVGLIDEWSREVFALLSPWASALGGDWTRWDPGYILLNISSVDGNEIDSILIDTADDEITISFGYWEMHIPGFGPSETAAACVREAIDLSDRWLAGTLRTAVFTDMSGKWCGSTLIEPHDPVPPAPFEGIESFNPTNVEIRAARKADWQSFPIERADR